MDKKHNAEENLAAYIAVLLESGKGKHKIAGLVVAIWMSGKCYSLGSKSFLNLDVPLRYQVVQNSSELYLRSGKESWFSP